MAAVMKWVLPGTPRLFVALRVNNAATDGAGNISATLQVTIDDDDIALRTGHHEFMELHVLIVAEYNYYVNEDK